MSDMIVRLATKEDARPVLDIRNDPMTRVQSVQNQTPFSHGFTACVAEEAERGHYHRGISRNWADWHYCY